MYVDNTTKKWETKKCLWQHDKWARYDQFQKAVILTFRTVEWTNERQSATVLHFAQMAGLLGITTYTPISMAMEITLPIKFVSEWESPVLFGKEISDMLPNSSDKSSFLAELRVLLQSPKESVTP